MTLALLLEATGELTGWDFDCEACDYYQKRIRGCGKAPMVPDWDGESDVLSTYERPWTPRWWMELVDKTGTLLPDDLAEQLWPYSDQGEAIEVTGTPWRCCPAWYARFSSPSARAAAKRAYDLLDWKEVGSLEHVQDGDLLDWQIDLIGVAKRARAAYQKRSIQRNQTTPSQQGEEKS